MAEVHNFHQHQTTYDLTDRTGEVPCGCTVEDGTNEIFHGHVRTDLDTDPGMAKAKAALRKGIKSGDIGVP
ncbi:hypothetical protein [Streptomyces sp. NPDC050548]|uniref:hypothetical protein n=1 Tax=Streptomyces sp. NPDC050548 TaxID=3365629 RepID=UPI0037B13BE1